MTLTVRKFFLVKNSHNSLNFQGIATKVIHNNFKAILHHVSNFRDILNKFKNPGLNTFFLKI